MTTEQYWTAATWVVLVVGVGYCLLDFILAMLLGRCVLPGMKCQACRRKQVCPRKGDG